MVYVSWDNDCYWLLMTVQTQLLLRLYQTPTNSIVIIMTHYYFNRIKLQLRCTWTGKIHFVLSHLTPLFLQAFISALSVVSLYGWTLVFLSILYFQSPSLSLRGLAAIFSTMRNSCLTLSNMSLVEEGKTNGEALLEVRKAHTIKTHSQTHKAFRCFTCLFALSRHSSLRLSPSCRPVSSWTALKTWAVCCRQWRTQLDSLVHSLITAPGERPLRLVFINDNRFDEWSMCCEELMSEIHVWTEAEIAVQRGSTRPTGPVSLTNENARLDTDWATASGEGFYPGKLFMFHNFYSPQGL